MMLLLWVQSGWATDVTVEQLTATIQEVAPFVEEEAARRFVELPPARVTTWQEEWDRQLAIVRTSYRYQGMDPKEADLQATTSLHTVMDGAAGLYTQLDMGFVVFSDVWQQLQSGGTRSKNALRCLVSHELVHALQHQYLSPHGTSSTIQEWSVPDQRALLEGHATLVGDRACQRLLNEQQARDIQAWRGQWGHSLPGVTWMYVEMPVWLAEQEALGGPEGLWAAVAGPNPGQAVVHATALALTPAGWETEAPLKTALEGLFGNTAWTAPGSVDRLTDTLCVSLSHCSELRSGNLGGWEGLIRSGEGRLFAGIYRLEHPERFQNLLDLRLQQQIPSVFPLVDPTVSPTRRLLLTDLSAEVPADRTVWLSGRPARFGENELWMQAGDMTLVLQEIGKKLEHRALVDLASSLLKQYPPATPEMRERLHRFLSVANAFDRPKPPAPTHPASPGWMWRFNKILRYREQDDNDACIRMAVPLLQDSPSAVTPWVARLLISCAHQPPRPEAMATGLAVLKENPDKTSSDRLILALDAQTREDDQGILDALGDASFEEEDLDLVEDLKMGAYGSLGRWKEATAIARQGGGTAVTRMWVAENLLDMNWKKDATAILIVTCERLTEKQDRCFQRLRALQR